MTGNTVGAANVVGNVAGNFLSLRGMFLYLFSVCRYHAIHSFTHTLEPLSFG